MTNGTYDFLKKIKEKYVKEKMLLMQNHEGAVLVHETGKKTVFSAPYSYEVISSAGDFENAAFAVMNYFPVEEDDQSMFEYHYQNKHNSLIDLPGFKGMRVLRPVRSNTFLIFTLWQKERDYLNWEQSISYQSFFKEIKPVSAQTQIFMSSSYAKKFFIPKEDH